MSVADQAGDAQTPRRSVVARVSMIAVTLVVSILVYLECIHALGFPDGHITAPHRLRRVVAGVLLGVNALALTVYLSSLVSPRGRRWAAVAAVHAALAIVLLGVMAWYSGTIPEM